MNFKILLLQIFSSYLIIRDVYAYKVTKHKSRQVLFRHAHTIFALQVSDENKISRRSKNVLYYVYAQNVHKKIAFHTFRREQNGRHSGNDILKQILLYVFFYLMTFYDIYVLTHIYASVN